MEKFKREHIFPSIIKGEIEENSMGLWLEKIKGHSYEPSEETDNKTEVEFGGDDDDDDEEVKAVRDNDKVNTVKESSEEKSVVKNDEKSGEVENDLTSVSQNV